uniref:Uncharacterized protein n=2 Tax=Spongospora subterranea TaxID=70186 RepID=A0A0H5RUI4_9EUKA|eukprot:CRZ12394.1 hypothetical protein [Spongospora subterranea]
MSAKDARLGVEKQSQRLNSTSAQEEEVRSVLSVNLSRACNEIRAVQADSCIHIGADADVNPNTLLPGTIDEPLPTVEFLRARRQSIVDCVKTIPTEMVHCSWNNTVDNLDKSLSSLGPTTEFENQTGKRLIAFYDDRSKSLATSKYRILARWNLFAVESEFLERFGPDMDTIVRETTDEYYNCRRRCERLKMGAPVMPSDIDGFVDARIRREESGAHVHTFITMLKWIVEDKRGQIFDDIETAATCAQTDESNLSMFIHHDNKSINDELAELMATLRIPIPKDMSNTHRLLSECRPMCKMLLRHAIEQRPRICYEEKSDNDDSQRIKKATWIADQKRAFVQIPPPEYVEYRRRFRDTDIDKMLLYQSMALEQSQDEAGFYDRANEQAKHAAAYAGSMYAAAVQEQGGALYEAPTTQKYMTLYLLKSALTIKLECNIIQTLNVFRAVQRRLVIDAVGGFALEDRLQLHSSQIIGRSSNPCQVSVEHQQPKDFVIPIEEFMAFSGIQTRDDLFEVVEGEPDCFRVRDADGVNIIYDVALNDWKTLRSELLAMGSLYIMKVDASVADKKCFDDEGSKPEHQKCSIECCRSAVLLDLYQCEFAYQSAKSRLVLALLEAYEHIVDPSSGQKLSQRIMDVIASRPQIDLDLCHFRQHYEAETRALQVRFGIVSDIVHHLVAAELSPTTMVRLSLFPFAEPIGLFDICHSVSHIVDW